MSHVKIKKAQTVKPDLTERLRRGLRSLLDMLVSLYMVILMVILPLYSTDTGYRRIGTDKCLFFRSVGVGVSRVVLPLAAVYLILLAVQRLRKREPLRISRTDRSVTDLFALIYLVAVVSSYLHTSFREETTWGDTFYGTYSWYLGLLTQLLFLAVYLMVSRLWQRKDWLICLWIPVLFVVSLLGYLNRFGIYPLQMDASGPHYISTIGNINWYCGYLVTILSGFVYYLWQERQLPDKWWLRIALYICMTVGFATLVTQGSSSGIVTLLILLGVFYLFSMKDGEKLQRFWSGCCLLSSVCVMTLVIRLIWPEAITYAETTTDLLTASPLPVLILAGSLLCLFLVYRSRKTGHFRAKVWVILGIIAWVAAGMAVVGYVILLVVNTLRPGSIGSLSGLGAFTFDAAWGSNRGITWMAGLTCFLDQDLLGKLVGVGPDAMAIYIHSGVNPQLQQLVEDYFGNLMLTNAHNEWLTVLINEGVLGAIGYIGLMVTAICRYLKAGREDPLAGAAGMGILAYTINNVFSFQQVMSTSAVFLLLGIGEACLRSGKQKNDNGK